MLYFPFFLSLVEFFSVSVETFPCDMRGELRRIKSRGVSFHPGESDRTLPRERRTEKNHIEQLRVP